MKVLAECYQDVREPLNNKGSVAASLNGVQVVVGSNPTGPTIFFGSNPET